MALPSFTAEQSLYRSSRHYRASALASIVGGVRPSDGQPGGTYLQSCSSCSYNGETLTCNCLDESGGSRQASLDVSNCVGDIGNNNGPLELFDQRLLSDNRFDIVPAVQRGHPGPVR